VDLPLAGLVSAAVTALAWQLGALSVSGGWAAWAVGVLILYGTGWSGGAVLAAFFVSSNLVSRVRVGEARESALDPKGDRRDAWQVLANGGPAAVAAIASSDARLAFWLVTASLAAAGADTWATSIGMHSRVSPRLLWSRRPVPPGTSGGVTGLGSVGAIVGALVVSAIAALVAGRGWLLPVGTLIGFLGMLVDSALGGALQGRFRCPRCATPSERRVHRCGTSTTLEGGMRWLTNDGVNLCATSVAATLGLAVWCLLD
jgi:uncharacterized protein (TIGR00297 family)